jgi:hypothetical protein
MSELDVPAIINIIQGIDCKYNDDEGYYYVTFLDKKHIMDYVELGVKLAKLLFESQPENQNA